MGKLNVKGNAVNSSCLGFNVNLYCFETVCLVYHLNVLKAESLKLRRLFPARISHLTQICRRETFNMHVVAVIT